MGGKSVNQEEHGGSAMSRRTTTFGWTGVGGLCVGLLLWNLGVAQAPPPEPPPKGPTYMPVVEVDFAAVRARDVAAKPEVMQRQRTLLAARYDLSDRPAAGVMKTGGMIFPDFEIKEIDRQEARSLQRFDADFDLPDHLLPEFPPPLFLTTRPELGDVSKGQLLTIKNFFALMDGIVTPVQMEGLRLLLTPFPQQQFNQTDDRKVDAPTLGVTCL